ncbi:hypothetical protein M9458_039895, partial [Cirrhinus mrigala]
ELHAYGCVANMFSSQEPEIKVLAKEIFIVPGERYLLAFPSSSMAVELASNGSVNQPNLDTLVLAQ